jgi:hypothetical protein
MTSLKVLNHVANQPEVLRYVAPGCAAIDLTNFFAEPGNVMMGDLDGVLLFGEVMPGVYEMHYLFTEALRGQEALRFVKHCLRIMFTEYGAQCIGGITPRENRAARAMNRALGARPVGEQLDPHGRTCIKYILEREQWAISSAASSAASAH